MRKTLASNGKQGKGYIIEIGVGRVLTNTIAEIPTIKFYKYNISFFA